jgi:multidrug transporter EmrE-like cation transporter
MFCPTTIDNFNAIFTMNHTYIFLTIFFTVYGQIVIKWQVKSAGELPLEISQKIQFILGLLVNPWIVSSLISAFIASLFWMAAMTKFPLSYAYPFMSIAFVLVMFMSAVLFKESITIPRAIGLSFIVIGIIIGSKG